jgi:hypothetical protein
VEGKHASQVKVTAAIFLLVPVYGDFQFKQRPEVRRDLGNAIAIDIRPGVPAFDRFCLTEIVA